MINLVATIRNRAFTLKIVALTLFNQELVSEIVFVVDGCEDNTEAVIRSVSRKYASINPVVVVNNKRLGTPASRNSGVKYSTNDFILFCDDDEFMEHGYARTCYEKLLTHKAGAVSGRRVYAMEKEEPSEAIKRFGNGIRKSDAFDYARCHYINDAEFDGDLRLPFTNANILTKSRS